MVSRQEAKTAGLTRYSTGKACPHGHISERYADNGSCCQCHAERRQTSQAKAQRAEYYQQNRERLAAKDAAHYQQNRENILVQKAEYYQQSREKIAAYRKANAERIAAQQAAYKKANRHILNAINAARRAAKLQATPRWADTAAIKAIYEQAAFMSKVLGEKQHVDHMYPLVSNEVCGLHVAANLQILTASDNLKKSNKLLPMYEML